MFLLCTGVRTFTEVTNGTKGYVCLVYHALAQSKVCVRQVGQGFEQNLRRHSGLEVGRVELVPIQHKYVIYNVLRRCMKSKIQETL